MGPLKGARGSLLCLASGGCTITPKVPNSNPSTLIPAVRNHRSRVRNPNGACAVLPRVSGACSSMALVAI